MKNNLILSEKDISILREISKYDNTKKFLSNIITLEKHHDLKNGDVF